MRVEKQLHKDSKAVYRPSPCVVCVVNRYLIACLFAVRIVVYCDSFTFISSQSYHDYS